MFHLILKTMLVQQERNKETTSNSIESESKISKIMIPKFKTEWMGSTKEPGLSYNEKTKSVFIVQ